MSNLDNEGSSCKGGTLSSLGPMPARLSTRTSPRLVDNILEQQAVEDKAQAVSCAEIAQHFWGEPTSTKPTESRWGTHGSRSVNLEKNVWFDHETNEGGDTIGLVEREIKCSRAAAIHWLLDGENGSEGFGSGKTNVVRQSAPLGRVVAIYDYTDEAGTLLFQVVRLEPKTFRQRSPDGNGGWRWSVKNVRQVPYRLPELREAIANKRCVLIVEGEKDVENLRKIGFAATCNAGGAGKWRRELSSHLRGAHVILVPDNDHAGRDHMNKVGGELKHGAAGIRLLELPGLQEKGDISDWLANGGTAEGLSALIERALPWIGMRAPFMLDKRDESSFDEGAAPSDHPSFGSAEESPSGTAERAPNTDNATFAALAKLSRVDYDRCRKESAKKLGISVATLDKEVEKFRQQDEEDTQSLPHWTVEPWAKPVDGVALLDRIHEVFVHHVVFPDFAADALALWILHAWTMNAGDVSPFLVLWSPEPRCGKTTVLILLYWLTPRSELASNISPAAIFRYIEEVQPTLLIDEVDTFVKDNEELRGILNSGHTRAAAHVIRVVGDDHKPRRFSTWAPKVMAGIGKLANTLRDRSIIVAMRRKTKGEKVRKLRGRDTVEFQELRQKAARWSEDASQSLENADPQLPDELNDRAADNWRPLIAIADLVGGQWRIRARQAALALSGEDVVEDDSIRVQLLADIKIAFETRGKDRLSTADLLAELTKDSERPWADWRQGRPMTPRQLASMLKSFLIFSDSIRVGDATPKGYLQSSFEDAWHRYL